MTVTLKDVAAAAGVSVSAVSRSFTPGAPIAAATRSRILRIAARMGYQRNHLAAGLTTGRTRLIAMLVEVDTDPETLRFVSLLAERLAGEGLRPTLLHAPPGRDPRAVLRALREHPPEAVVIVSAAAHPAIARALRGAGWPVVQALASQPAAADTPLVALGETGVGRMAASILLSRGYRHLAFVGGPAVQPAIRDRWAGFRNLAERHGATIAVRFAAASSYAEGRREVLDLLAAGGADAYFCTDDRLAIGALAALRESGVAVPARAGLLGLGGIEAGGWTGIDLSTLAPPMDRMVTETAGLLLAALRGEPVAAPQRRFEAVLVERGTLRPPAARPALAAE